MKVNEDYQSLVIVPKSWLEELRETQSKILSLLEKEGNFSIKEGVGDYISETDAKKLLGKKTTWFWNMRTSGQLAFSKIGGTNYYDKNDIVKLLEKNRKEDYRG